MTAPDEGNLLIVPVPSLVSVLLARRGEKGAALSEAEVVAVRDAAACIMMPRDVAQKVAAERGYDDIDPENVWPAWQDFIEWYDANQDAG